MDMAEKEGFEPSVRGYRTYAFQAHSFGHSDTSPYFYKLSFKLVKSKAAKEAEV